MFATVAVCARRCLCQSRFRASNSRGPAMLSCLHADRRGELSGGNRGGGDGTCARARDGHEELTFTSKVHAKRLLPEPDRPGHQLSLPRVRGRSRGGGRFRGSDPCSSLLIVRALVRLLLLVQFVEGPSRDAV